MSFSNKKYRIRGRSSNHNMVLKNSVSLSCPLNHQSQESNLRTKSDLTFEKNKLRQRDGCTKCDASYNYKKNLACHLYNNHPRTTSLLKKENKENRFSIRNLSICLKKLSEKDILAASKKLFTNKDNAKKHNEKRETIKTENHLCISNVEKQIEKRLTSETGSGLCIPHAKEQNKRQNSEIVSGSCASMSSHSSAQESDSEVFILSTERAFKCFLCFNQFHGELEFEKHFKSVHSHSQKVIKCSDCLKEFEESEVLFWHCRTVHFQLRLHKCPDCEVMSLDKRQISNHISLVHKKAVFECWVCDEAFEMEDNLIEHFNDHHFL